jgi:ATP-dependent helicase/DNAse subunit B
MLAEEPESTRLIVPTQRGVGHRMRGMARGTGGGFLGRPVVTFEEFASGLLRGTADDLPLVSRTMQTLLLKGAVQKADADGVLEFLGEAARSPGFLNHVQHMIAQLKQGAVKPADFRERVARRDRPSAFDAVVAEIYTNYQNALVEAHTFDLQGMYWLADLACQYTEPAGLAGISTLLIDGFDDFTPSEFTLIASVARHVERLVFGLNYDIAPDRRDAYALLRETHGKVRGAFDCTEVNCEDGGCESESTCEQIVGNLFWRDATALRRIRGNLRADLTLVACHTVTHEVESVGRAIKRRIVEEGVSPGDVLIVLKNADAYARVLGEVFDEAGIPLEPVESATLLEVGFVRMLLKVYESAGDWEREAVLGVLTSGEFQSLCDSPVEHVAAYRHVAYRAGIVGGRSQWRDRLLGLSERLLVDLLGVPLERAESEAHQLEHAISPALLTEIEKRLDYPDTCPYGRPIYRENEVGPREEPTGTIRLSDATAGVSYTVARIPDEDYTLLCFLVENLILPGQRISVDDNAPYRGVVDLHRDGAPVSLGMEVVARIRVRPV